MSISPDPGGLLRSPLEYPTNGVVPIRVFLFRRDPIDTQDFKNFKIRDMWISSVNNDVWMLTSKNRTSGTWTKLSTGGAGGIFTITGNSGEPVSSNSAGNVSLLGGSGATVTGDPGSNTLTIDVSASGLTWTTDVSGPVNVNAGEGHIADAGGAITYNLPATCAVGDGFAFISEQAGGFVVTAAAGDQIRMGNQISSLGGSISSTAVGDVLELMCVTADSRFFVVDSVGNFILT